MGRMWVELKAAKVRQQQTDQLGINALSLIIRIKLHKTTIFSIH